ncbi:hypothetical protein [uncultured Gordonia sp.]|uniref:hypothetical protein n=1 Tax=uncultured Gordonia sp. TaxID=198437 RepID=UPI00258EBBCE|nr:hypothetical protein [uncultured Gordonia sp.]
MKRRTGRPEAALVKLVDALADPIDRAAATECSVQLLDALVPLLREEPDDPLLRVLNGVGRSAGLWAFFGEERDREALAVGFKAARMLGGLELLDDAEDG